MAAGNQQRPVRSLAFVALLLIGLYVGVALGGVTRPALGLDLRGGTQAILTAQTQKKGGAVSSGDLAQAVAIIRERVNGLGVSAASVTTQGSDHIVVAVPGAGHDAVVNRVGQTALLRFRQVLQEGPGTPTPTSTATPTPTATATPGTKSTAKAAPSAKPSASASVHPDVVGKALEAASPSPKPATSAKPAASAKPTPAPTPAAPATGKDITAGISGLPAATSLQQLYAEVNCSKPKVRAALSSLDRANSETVACSQDGTVKYLLAPAKVVGTEVSGANASLGTQGWEVNLSFNGAGTKAWANLTSAVTSLPAPTNEVAIVLDGQVVSAPRIIQAILGGQAQITGSFTQTQATDLANVLKYGALPLKFELSSVQTVSATLGSDQLRGGLIAGAIGLGLVVLYSFLYYRALGLVVVASLALSGGLLYAATVLLGETISYTLTLAGIAGFIVAVGITADSFVVFFERIRDEIREGHSITLRSAVERGWPRARRTILSADTVSLLAALILYLLSVGDVRGFAFTLGLSTLSDLFIVFLFTKPLMSLLVQTRFFSSDSRFSGLAAGRGPGRYRANRPARRPTAAASKES